MNLIYLQWQTSLVMFIKLLNPIFKECKICCWNSKFQILETPINICVNWICNIQRLHFLNCCGLQSAALTESAWSIPTLIACPYIPHTFAFHSSNIFYVIFSPKPATSVWVGGVRRANRFFITDRLELSCLRCDEWKAGNGAAERIRLEALRQVAFHCLSVYREPFIEFSSCRFLSR